MVVGSLCGWAVGGALKVVVGKRVAGRGGGRDIGTRSGLGGRDEEAVGTRRRSGRRGGRDEAGGRRRRLAGREDGLCA